MTIDPVQLKAMILGTPELASLAAAGNHAAIARWLNEPSGAKAPSAAPVLINKRAIHKTLGLTRGTQLLQSLASIAASQPVFAEVLDLLRSDAQGVDIAHAESRSIVDQLVTLGLLSAQEAAGIKALGEVETSRATSLLQASAPVSVTHLQVARALAS